jgi:hypothetical protein
MRQKGAAVAVVAVVAAVFAQAVRFPLTCWDDGYHVSAPLSWLTPQLGYPIPLTVASWALLGRSAVAAHAWNVALHAGAALLVLALSLQLRRGVWPALLFAVHPIVAEPVAWATGRKDLLAASLVLLAVVLHVKKPRPPLTALLYLLALAAKPSALPLPAILWAHDRLLQPERKRAWLFALVPLGVADAVLGVLGDRALGGIRDVALPLWQRVPLAAGLEARHLFAPVGLLPRYLELPSVPTMLLGAVALAALFASPFLLRRRAPVAAFAVAFAALAYLPAADLVHRTRFVGDVYLYLPLTGLVLLLGSPKVPRWAPPVLFAVYLPLGFLQTRTWRSNVTMFEPVANAYPDAATAWKQLGDSFMCDGRPADALAPYRVVDEKLGSTIALGNLGLAYERLGDRARAEAAYERGAVAGDPKAAAHLSRLRQSVLPKEPR